MSAIKLENVLQQMFMECDASMSVSTPDSPTSIGDEMTISKIVQYVQEQLPTWPIDDLTEFWKCLTAISPNDRVNLWQFKEATKCWITKMEQIQSSPDDNNNAREKLYLVSDTDSSMKDMDMNRDIVEFELRAKLRELHEENLLLRDELERHETSFDNLRQQCNIAERQLDRYIQKCQQLEKENDEQREQLNEAIKNEKATALTLQRCTKEQQNLLKQLEAAEIEVQAIPPLKCKLEKISKEKMDCVKQSARLQEKFNETEDECKQLKATIIELEEINIKMKEAYDQTIHNLRERNCQLTEENTELQSLSILNKYSSGERLSMSPIPDMDGCCTHSTPYKSEKIQLQDSLYAELKASGFVADCSRYDLYRQELDEYDAAISTILEQLERVVQIFDKMRSSNDDVPQFNSQDDDVETCNIDALKHKVALLLNMVTEEITRKNTKDSSTQLRADSGNVPSDQLDQFGVMGFRDLLLTRTQSCIKTKTDLSSIILCNYVNNKKDDHNDSFLRVIKAHSTSTQNRFHIIEPIIEELYDIIESTHNAFISHKNHSSSGNSRYRSVHTLPSQSLQAPLLIEEESKQRSKSSDQSSRADSPDTSFARGDFCLTQESCNEKSSAAKPQDMSDKDNLISNRSSEMPKLNVLEEDSTAPTSEERKANAKNVQEVIATSNPSSPRRKISVYCRSFDVVTMQESCEARGSSLEIRRSSSNPGDSPARINEMLEPEIFAENQSSTPKYTFSSNYRSTKNYSDSSNGSSPQKQFRDTLLEEESPIEQPILRKICLAPTRLKLPEEIKNELKETACAETPPDSVEPNISDSLLSPILNNGCEGRNDVLRASTTFIINKCKTEDSILESQSCTANETVLRKCSTSHTARRLFPYNNTDSRKIVDSENPHSQPSVQRVEYEPRFERSVDGQMSSCEEDSSSDSECEPAAKSGDRCIDEKVDRAASAVSSTSVSDLASAKIVPVKQENTKTCDRDLLNAKQEKRQRFLSARKSLSESESISRSRCRCRHQESVPLIPEGDQRRVFPSLTDVCLQESGIANLLETDSRENLSELELQKRYIVFSLCLSIDRVTLLRRVAMSLRQRDQSEKNLSNEVQKMQQDIQELAPLCTDRESVERVERVRHQLDMIVECARRVSCTAETLGAVCQEHRVSRAIQLADKYLRLLQSRCEKLIVDIAETKRILIENNIVIEENSGELYDDLPRIRYRSGTPANNRIMMARRRASVATMSRPIGSTQDVIKDIVRQRNSVSGRMTLRRPSFNSESPKCEPEKLNRTDSSSSASELRGIFEQIESRRSSKEENNNMLRLSHSNSQNVINEVNDNETWTNTMQTFESFADNEDINIDVKSSTRSSPSFLKSIPWHTILWGIIIFFLGFFMNQVMVNACNGPLHGWSIDYILSRYIYKITNAAPPM